MENLSGFICFLGLVILLRLGLVLFGRLVLRLNGAVDFPDNLIKRQSRLGRRNLINKRLGSFAFRLNILLFGVADKLLYIHSVAIRIAIGFRADINRNIFLFLPNKAFFVSVNAVFYSFTVLNIGRINSFFEEKKYAQNRASGNKHQRSNEENNEHNGCRRFSEKHLGNSAENRTDNAAAVNRNCITHFPNVKNLILEISRIYRLRKDMNYAREHSRRKRSTDKPASECLNGLLGNKHNNNINQHQRPYISAYARNAENELMKCKPNSLAFYKCCRKKNGCHR